MRKALIIGLIAILLATTPVIVSAEQPNQVKKIVKKSVTKKSPKKVVPKKKTTKKVLGLATYIFNPIAGFVSCDMPDGKTIRVPKKDCDAVKAFWGSIKHSNPTAGNSSGGGSNSSSNNNSNNNPASTIPTPSVTSVTVLPCTSASCNFITTIIVDGVGFTSNTRVAIIGLPDGVHIGGNSSTQIITDFYNVAPGTYNLKIYSTNGDTQEVIYSSITI